MKIYGFVEDISTMFGHGDSRTAETLAVNIFFKSRELAEQYAEENDKRPPCSQVVDGRWVEGKVHLQDSTIKEFELQEI